MNSTSSRLCAAALAATLVLGTATAAHAQRDGYRHHRHHNWGPPAAALLGGLVIGGMIANNARPAYAYPAYPAPAYVARSPHHDWCAASTPGYNAYDNTFQGYYAGERVYCRSPYGG